MANASRATSTSWVTECPTLSVPASPSWGVPSQPLLDGTARWAHSHGMARGMAFPCTARDRAQRAHAQQGNPAGGTSWAGMVWEVPGELWKSLSAAAAEHLRVLRVTAPSSSSASPSPAAWKITLRGAKERPELTQVCRETSHSPLRTLSNAHWPLPGWPSQEWKCLSRTTEGGVDRCCSHLQTSPHCLPPQIYKSAGFPLPKQELEVGSGRKVAQAGGSWATPTTTTGGRCSWGQFCAMF